MVEGVGAGVPAQKISDGPQMETAIKSKPNFKYIYWVGINTKTAKTVLKLPKLGTFLEMYPVLAFKPVYLPILTEVIGR